MAAAALAGLGIAQTDGGREALGDLGIAPAAEPYTELALARPDAVPAVADGVVAMPFWIRNAEGARREYRWTATVRPEGGTAARAASGRLALDDGAARTVRARVPVTCAGDRVRVEIAIGGPHRAVGAWVPCGEGSP